MIEKNINDIIEYAIHLTAVDMIEWIKTYVPKRTGQLQDSLIEYIQDNWNYTYGFTQLELSTNVEYAASMIGDPSHTATIYEHSGKLATADYYGWTGLIFLNDPEAIAEWGEVIPFVAKETWLRNLQIAIDYIIG